MMYTAGTPPMMRFNPLIIIFWIIGGALGVYHLVLQILMTMGVYRTTGGRATAAVILGLIIGIILIVLVFGILGVIIGIAVVTSVMHR
jgi:hypothetical protein